MVKKKSAKKTGAKKKTKTGNKRAEKRHVDV